MSVKLILISPESVLILYCNAFSIHFTTFSKIKACSPYTYLMALQRNLNNWCQGIGSPFVREDSATCWVSFWDLNGPIITALERINGDLPASAHFTMGDGKGVTRCTKTLWRRWQVQPPHQKSFFQNVWLWKPSAKWHRSFSYTWDSMAVLHSVNLLCHCYTAACNCPYCQWGCLEESLQYQNPVATCR